MVRYEMHRRASSRYGATKASVGHASRHRRQLPHKSGGGLSVGPSDGAKSREVRITPRNSHDPYSLFKSSVFLPSHPSPACLAKTRSATGPVSAYARAAKGSGIFSFSASTRAFSFFHITMW